MSTELLLPPVVLILWSLVMLAWLAATRLPALGKVGIDMSTAVGGRGQDIDPRMPPAVAWKSHNYAHLMEQPTLFYATVVILAVVGAGSTLTLLLAWGYVAIRIAHSVWQATVNKVPVRFALFGLATLCQLGLALIALTTLL